MKKIAFFSLCMIFLFSSCDEIPPEVTGTQSNRRVLIEEFTGVRCVNCPAGSAVIEDLLASHGDQLIAVSIHAGDFSFPYPESDFNFTSDDGDAIINFVGVPFGYPSAVVNRNQFDGEFGLQLGASKWAGYIAEELQEEPKVEIAIQHNFNSTNNQLDLDVTILVQENIAADDVRLSVIIVEDNIADVQLTPDGKQEDYVHKHVFRDAITSFDGDQITANLVAGAQITESYTYTISDDWEPNNCNVIVFVNLAGDQKEILQAVEAHVVE